MKTIITTIIIASIFTAESFANGNQKFYEITDHGQFRFTYPLEQDAISNKAGLKPVTERTFYLEAARQGLLPEDMTYYTFIQLTIEEKQAILKNRQFVLASDPLPLNLHTAKTILAELQSAVPSEQTATEADQQSAEQDIMAPWLVKAVTRPGTEHNLPTDPIIWENEVLNNDLPWAVDVILNEAQQTNEKQMAAMMKVASTLTATK